MGRGKEEILSVDERENETGKGIEYYQTVKYVLIMYHKYSVLANLNET